MRCLPSNKKDQYVAVCVLLVFMIAIVFAPPLMREFWVQANITPGLETELGFRFGTPIIDDGNSILPDEVVAISHIEPNGIFEKAGFKCGDIIVTGETIGELSQRIEDCRGKICAIRVISNEGYRRVPQRDARVVEVWIPSRKH